MLSDLHNLPRFRILQCFVLDVSDLHNLPRFRILQRFVFDFDFRLFTFCCSFRFAVFRFFDSSRFAVLFDFSRHFYFSGFLVFRTESASCTTFRCFVFRLFACRLAFSTYPCPQAFANTVVTPPQLKPAARHPELEPVCGKSRQWRPNWQSP